MPMSTWQKSVPSISVPPGLPEQKRHVLSNPCHVIAILSVIVLLGLAIRAYQLSDRSLWFDEAFSWRSIQFPFMEMLQRVGRDNHPPLHFVVLKGWAILFGDSAFALRSLSVLFGGLTILGAYLFATEAFGKDLLTVDTKADLQTRGRVIGLLVATLVALSAFHIRYSQELRMYTMAAALAAFSSWALFRALQPPSRLGRWLLYGLLALLMAYTHYYGLFTLAGQAVFVAAMILVRAQGRVLRLFCEPALRHALLAAILVFLGWLPWLPSFFQQRAQVKAKFWSHVATRWSVAEECYHMFTVREYFDTPSRQQQLLAADLCVLGLWLLRRKAGAAEWYVLGSAVTPLLCCIAVSAPFTLRYLIMAHLFLLVGLAVLIWRVPFRLERGIVLAMTLAIFAGLYSDYWRDLDAAHKPGARGAAAFLKEQRRPEEPVIVCAPFFFFPLLHYTPDRAGYYLYSPGRPFPHHDGTAAMTSDDLITEEQLRNLPSRRVWVVAVLSAISL
jgi:mannosyltransferase